MKLKSENVNVFVARSSEKTKRETKNSQFSLWENIMPQNKVDSLHSEKQKKFQSI